VKDKWLMKEQSPCLDDKNNDEYHPSPLILPPGRDGLGEAGDEEGA